MTYQLFRPSPLYCLNYKTITIRPHVYSSDQFVSKNTPDAYAYQTIPNLDLTNKNSVQFSVKACNDAHITLQPTITGLTR